MLLCKNVPPRPPPFSLWTSDSDRLTQRHSPHARPRGISHFLSSSLSLQTQNQIDAMKTMLTLALVAAVAAKTDSDGWTLLVKQDSSNGQFFPRTELADGEYNIDHPEDKLYSHLDVDYSKFKSTDGKMTLQLRWPTIVNAEKTLTWRQSSSPLAAHGKVTGYEIGRNQEHDWSQNNNADNFNGIAKSTRYVAPLLARPCPRPSPAPPVADTVRAPHTPAFFSMPPSARAHSWTARRRRAARGTRSAPTRGMDTRTAPRFAAFPVRGGLARQWPPMLSSATSSFG